MSVSYEHGSATIIVNPDITLRGSGERVADIYIQDHTNLLRPVTQEAVDRLLRQVRSPPRFARAANVRRRSSASTMRAPCARHYATTLVRLETP